MTQEDKELLLKDLCARLPYGLVIDFNGIRTTLHDIKVFQLYDGDAIKDYICLIDIFGDNDYINVENIKPYLFPLSSMTEEQKKEFDQLLELELKAINDEIDQVQVTVFEVDFYNKYHLDWRGLIPLGLAIDATGKNIY